MSERRDTEDHAWVLLEGATAPIATLASVLLPGTQISRLCCIASTLVSVSLTLLPGSTVNDSLS